MDISIIIPVYNAEKYLQRCVNSALRTIEALNGEIILVNNASTDGSNEIIKRYQQKTTKVRVANCDTPGAAAARNAGERLAKGKYIWFVDADDYVGDEAGAKLIEKAVATEADLVMMGAERVYEDGHCDYLSAVDASSENWKSRFVRYGMGPWQVLLRRKWWDECGFGFREGMIHEDMELMSALALYTDKFASIDKPLYFYCQTPNSVLHKRSWSEHAYDIFPALEGLYERFRAFEAQNTYYDELEWFFIWNLLIDSAKDFARFPEGRDGFARSREILSRYFPNWRKNRFLREKPLKLRIRVRLNYYRR